MQNKIRQVMLFVPGNTPRLFQDITFYRPDTVMFDLEDSVILGEKTAARELTFQLINHYDFERYNIEVAVRINDQSSSFFLDDLAMVVQSKASMIRLPKVVNVDELLKVISQLEKSEQQHNRTTPINLFCAIESAEGVLNAAKIATAHPRVVGIALGGVDYLFDLQAHKTAAQTELLYARQTLVHAARAAKIDVFDCIYGNINDDAGLIAETQFAKSLGFSGKSVIHPKQIALVKQIFAPSATEISWAKNLLLAYEKFQTNRQGVFTFDNQMIDKPIIEHAQKIIKLITD